MGLWGSTLSNRWCGVMGGLFSLAFGLFVVIFTGERVVELIGGEEWQVLCVYFILSTSSTMSSFFLVSFLLRLLFGNE